MGRKLFGVNISGEINSAIGPGVEKGTLTKVTQGTRDTADPAAGKKPTTKEFTCRGFFARTGEGRIRSTILKKGTRVAVILGDSIQGGQVPRPNDKVTFEGKETTIVGTVERDPAAATYICPVGD